MRADGLVQAINEALKNSGLQLHDIDFRITDTNGKQYYFKEAALALERILRKRKEEFDIWHPADCVGEVGSAILPIIFSNRLTMAPEKDYLIGKRILCHSWNDNSEKVSNHFKRIF